MKKRLANVALGCLAVALTFAVLEGGARLVGCAPEVHAIDLDAPDSVYTRSENPILGYELKKRWRDEHADLHRSYPSTNAHGFRDVERPLERADPNQVRVLVLGDSVVAGHGIAALEDTIPGRLQRHLPRLDVLNLGIGGYCTRGEVELLRTRGLAFNPDFVVLVFVENDYDDLNSQIGIFGDAPERPAWAEWLFLRSHLFRWGALKTGAYAFDAAEASPQAAHMDAVGNDNVAVGLHLLADLSKQHRFQTLVAIWPGFTEHGVVEREAGRTMADHAGLRIEALAHDLFIPTLRLSGAFRADAIERGGFSAGYYSRDGMHPTAAASEVAARALAAAIRDRMPQ